MTIPTKDQKLEAAMESKQKLPSQRIEEIAKIVLESYSNSKKHLNDLDALGANMVSIIQYLDEVHLQDTKQK